MGRTWVRVSTRLGPKGANCCAGGGRLGQATRCGIVLTARGVGSGSAVLIGVCAVRC